MKKIITMLFMLAMLATTASAAYDIDIDNDTVTVSGTAAGHSTVIVAVLKPGDFSSAGNASNVALIADKTFFTDVKTQVSTMLVSPHTEINNTNFETYKKHFAHVVADGDGVYEIDLPFVQDATYDVAYLLVGSYDNTAEGTIIYVPSAATEASAKAAINGAVTEGALAAKIDELDFVFGLNTESAVYKNMKNEIAKAILVMKNGVAYTSFTDLTNNASFKCDFNEALAYYTRQTAAVDEINSATVDSLKTILENYSQGVNVIGAYGGEKLDFLTAYDAYGYMEVNRLLVGYTYEDMSAFIDAFKSAVATLGESDKNPQPGTPSNPIRPSGPSGSGGGGGMYVPTTQVPKVENADDGSFKDLDQAPWAEESIMNLVGRGVVNGMGNGLFNPNGNVTREQFVKMLLLSFSIEPSSAGGNFADVDGGQWYAPYVNTAYELGIVNGVSETEFGVGMNITRQDLVTMIIRACDAYGLEVSKTQSVSFTDENEIADYAYDAVMDLAAAGVINGVTDGVFAPAQNATRAQVSVILDRLYNV